MISKGIYIDDAATPGTQSKSDFLPEDRKSYCAVIVFDEAVDQLSKIIKTLLDGSLKKDSPYGLRVAYASKT